MAFDTFLDIAEVPGESTAKDFDGKIEIYSFSFGVSNPVTISSGTKGSSGGKASLSSFNIMKKTDKASPLLFAACASGDHFAKAVVTMRKAGGEAGGQSVFLKYEFENVFVESVQWSGSTGGDDTPTESASLAYGKVTINYQPQDAKGATGDPIIKSWNVQTVSPD
jgi:type VI secretion system secreted protein Hcp